MIEKQGGRFWVESAPDEGTYVHFTLAAAPVDQIPQEPRPRRDDSIMDEVPVMGEAPIVEAVAMSE
jgi:hypothetical protein